MNFSLFVSCPKGLEYLLEEEVKILGLKIHRVNPQGVYGEGDLSLIYRLCLWSRLANRIQLILCQGNAAHQKSLYETCYAFPWHTVFANDKTLAIEFHGTSPTFRNSMFGAQVIKDAIVDYFRNEQGVRPTIDRESPDIRLHAYLKNDVITVSLDLVGTSLHQRGYRISAGSAPIKENIAAAMLLRAKWPALSAEGFDLHDPFCGSGTIVIEAAMMAANLAPGLLRKDQSFKHWTQHQPLLWESIQTEARLKIKSPTIRILGTDLDASVIAKAQANAEQAGVAEWVHFETVALADCQGGAKQGLMITNPPYGERLGDAVPWIALYQQLGHILHSRYDGWQAGILTSNPMLAKAIGLRSQKQYTLYNGALECKLYCITVNAENELKTADQSPLSDGAEMLYNRLQKNYDHLKKWAKREQISCYRVYDADLPEYAYAIDIYNDHAVLQEYAAPAIIAADKVEKRSREVLQVVPRALGMAPQSMIIKQRKQQKGTSQYQKITETKRTMMVTEGQAKLMVNLHDYIDTGLFLDHRLLRLRFAKLPKGIRFLNCFCYTATASVHAALAGALTTNVDLSNTYLRWAEENFKLNHIDVSKHQFIPYDCLQWLKDTSDHFDVIFLDPPSFSNSKRMLGALDIQRDHASLIDATMRLLNRGGTLYFSTNFRSFVLSTDIMEKYSVRDISDETIDVDFKRNKRIHRCFMISALGL